MSTEKINIAKDFFYHQHDIECNQKYNKTLPYSFHLEMVVAMAEKFKTCLLRRDDWSKPLNSFSKSTIWDEVVIGCLGHDSIEDARVTYNDLEELFGPIVAEIIYCCTEVRGHNRDERHSVEYYEYLAKNDLAVFVKLCDICANATFSLLSNSSMFKKHKAEHEKTKQYLYKEQYKPIFDYLEGLFKL
jgi:(p)ppGpp synthase/HD superfamily hydrolase